MELFPLEVNVGGVSVSEDVNLRLSQLKGQDEKKVQEEKKVWPARVCAPYSGLLDGRCPRSRSTRKHTGHTAHHLPS